MLLVLYAPGWLHENRLVRKYFNQSINRIWVHHYVNQKEDYFYLVPCAELAIAFHRQKNGVSSQDIVHRQHIHRKLGRDFNNECAIDKTWYYCGQVW